MKFGILVATLALATVITVSALLYADRVEFEQEKEDVLPLIAEYCNDASGVKNAIGYHYSNETHFINNETCEWQKLPFYPNSTVVCDPYTDKRVAGEGIGNGTHIFDKDSCSWEDDPDHDPLNSKGCPQFCPKEKDPTRYEKYLDENGELDFGLQYSKNGMVIDDLQRIFDWCDYPGEKPEGWHFGWNNYTHHIDSENCEWTDHED